MRSPTRNIRRWALFVTEPLARFRSANFVILSPLRYLARHDTKDAWSMRHRNDASCRLSSPADRRIGVTFLRRDPRAEGRLAPSPSTQPARLWPSLKSRSPLGLRLHLCLLDSGNG